MLGGRDNHYTTETKVKNVVCYTIIEMGSKTVVTIKHGHRHRYNHLLSLELSSSEVHRTLLDCTQPVANIPYNLLKHKLRRAEEIRTKIKSGKGKNTLTL